MNENLLRTHWTGRQLANLQSILAPQKEITLNEVAELTKAIMETISPGPSVCATDVKNGDRYEEFEKQAVKLTREIAKLSADSNRGRCRERSHTRSRARTSDRIVQCW